MIESELIKLAEDIYSNEHKQRIIVDLMHVKHVYEGLKHLDRDLSEANILDIGCSRGDVLLLLKKLGARTLAGLNLFPFDKNVLNDKNKSNLFEMLEISSKINFFEKERVIYLQHDCDNKELPLEDDSTDLVFLLDVFEHLHNPYFVMKEISRILREKGVLILSTPNGLNLKNRMLCLFGKSPYFPIEKWLKDERRYIPNYGDTRFIGHIREYSFQEVIYSAKLTGLSLENSRLISVKGIKGLKVSFYRMITKLYPKWRYHMIFAFKKNTSIII